MITGFESWDLGSYVTRSRLRGECIRIRDWVQKLQLLESILGLGLQQLLETVYVHHGLSPPPLTL